MPMQHPVPRIDPPPPATTGAGSPDVPVVPSPPPAPARAADESADARLAPPGGSPWIRYAALIAIVIVLVVLYGRRLG